MYVGSFKSLTLEILATYLNKALYIIDILLKKYNCVQYNVRLLSVDIKRIPLQ